MCASRERISLNLNYIQNETLFPSTPRSLRKNTAQNKENRWKQHIHNTETVYCKFAYIKKYIYISGTQSADDEGGRRS